MGSVERFAAIRKGRHSTQVLVTCDFAVEHRPCCRSGSLPPAPAQRSRGLCTGREGTRQVTGSAYHDHNWGNVSPANLFENWWWGRSKTGSYTIVAADIHGKAALGGTRIPRRRAASQHPRLLAPDDAHGPAPKVQRDLAAAP
jgi:hypothetical protein